jgi:hypothetical protein
MSEVVFGFISCIAFVVIVLFNVGVFTPHWVTVQETVSNTTNSTRTCTYGLFYSLDCPDNESGEIYNILQILLIFVSDGYDRLLLFNIHTHTHN